MFYDLHSHSALSPCADDDMTPAVIAGMMAVAKADIFAITDHNSARNLEAAQKAADFYEIKLLPGIEVNSAEEIHLLCYFSGLDAALEMGERIYESLPAIAVDTKIWGEQLVIDENDEIIDKVEKLLSLASSYDIYEILDMVKGLDGIVVPAHVDRDSNSLVQILGFMPDDLDIHVVEMTNRTKYEGYVSKRQLPSGLEIVTSSDAHSINQLIGDSLSRLNRNSKLMRLIERL